MMIRKNREKEGQVLNHRGTKTLETERLILRQFRVEDAEPMFRNWASDPEVTKYLTWAPHANVEISRLVAASWVNGYADPKTYQWAIEWKESAEPIGSISAVHVDDRTGAVAIGYCIGRAYWGRGVMPEALRAVIAFFFAEVGANSVRACHDPHNPNSGRVMQKCGMTREGTFRRVGFSNQGICDEVWYSILREEYRPDSAPAGE